MQYNIKMDSIVDADLIDTGCLLTVHHYFAITRHIITGHQSKAVLYV